MLQMASKLIKVLLGNGASAEVEDEEGLSPLHIVCKVSELQCKQIRSWLYAYT